MSEYTTLADLVRGEPDMTPLATIAGAAYYELRLIVRCQDGRTHLAGRASDWPVIARDARIAELEALLDAERRHAEEAERHVAELIQQLALAEQAAPTLAEAPPPAAPDPPAGASESQPSASFACPECDRSFSRVQGLAAHRTKAHGYRKVAFAAPPTAVPIVPVVVEAPLVEPPWTCARCASSAHARGVARPSLCIRCNATADEAPHTNGHAVATR